MSFFCESCNKNYSSYKSLWLHNKKYHKDITNTQENKSQICEYCNKQLYDKTDNEEFDVEDSADVIEQVKDANGKTIGVMSFVEE